jgi:tRNA pseudouridine55 synthase
LRRTASGNFQISEAVTLEDLTLSFAAGDWKHHLRPADEAVWDWPEVGLTAEAAARIQHGQSIPLEEYADDRARAYNPAGEFIALLRADTRAGVWRPHKVFISPRANANSA